MKIQKIIKIDLNKSSFAYPVRVVQYDTGVQLVLTLTDFEIPDGTTAIVYFMKPSGKFVYQEDNISISGNTITVDVHNQAFTEYGKVKYQVELTNGSDIITTFSRIVEVEKSLSNSGGDKSTTVIRAFEELTADKIAEIEASTLDYIDSVNQGIEAKGEEVLASIPDDYTEMSNKVDYLYDNVANALKGNVSGSVVKIDDVSPIKHKPIVRVCGKNLFDISKITDTDTAKNNGDGSLTILANTYYCRLTQTLREVCPQLRAGDVATLSFNTECANVKYMYFHGLQSTWNVGHHITLTDAILDSYITVYGYPDTDPSYGKENVISNIQIELGTTVTDYEEYIDPTTVTLTRCGKNFWHSKNLTYPRTVSGITMDYDPESQVYTFNGTSTAPGDLYVCPNNYHIMNIKAGETWTLKVEVVGGNIDGIASTSGKMSPLVNTTDYSNSIHANNESLYLTKTYTEPADITKMYFYVYSSGLVFNNLQIRIQFEQSKKPTEFEKFKDMSSYTPLLDGTVSGVTSLSPNMVITTDTANAVVDCEYIKDSNAVINKLINAIVALGGSV